MRGPWNSYNGTNLKIEYMLEVVILGGDMGVYWFERSKCVMVDNL